MGWRCLLLGMLTLFALGRVDAAALELSQLGEVYFDPDQPTAIHFRSPDGAGGTVSYRIEDYLHVEVARGDLPVGADGGVTVPVELPAGYYELQFPESQQSFGLLAMAAYQGKPDYFFGINAGFSWFPNGDVEVAKMAALKRCGIAIIHEFLSWQQIDEDTKPDTWQSGTGLYYQLVRQRLADQGLKVLEEFHDAPVGSGADMNERSTARFPKDMLYVNRSWTTVFQRLAGYLGGLEVWNETDDRFGPICGYVPLVKTIAWTRQETGVDVPIVGGIFSQMAGDGFREGSGLNRMIEVVDAISYHNYADPMMLEETVVWYRDFLARYGRESLPVHITESGWPWTTESAKNIVMKAVEAKACGIAQMYPFFAQFYQEGALDFAMVRANQTPYPSLACYGRLAKLLSNFEYVGDLRHQTPEILRARVFSNGTEYVAVIFTRHTGSTFPTPGAPILRVEGIDGRALPVTPVTVATDGMLYWFLKPEVVTAHFERLIDTGTTAMALWQRGQLPLAAKKLSPVVLQPRLDAAQLICGQQRPSGYFIADAAQGTLHLTVDVVNLSAAALDARLRLEVPAGIAVTPDAASDTVAVGGKAQQTVGWTLDAREYLQSQRGFAAKVVATDPTGQVLDYCSIPLLSANQERQVYGVKRWSAPGRGAWPDAAVWEEAEAIRLSRNQQWEQDDFAVDARFLWDDAGLYFRFEVRDTIHAQENDVGGAWRQDSIQLAFDPVNSMRSDGTQYEYGMSLYQGQPRWSYWIMGQKKAESMSADTGLRIERDAESRRTVYRGRLAWAEIAPFAVATTRELGFDFCVNNSNGDQVYENLEWTPGISSGGKDSSLFGRLQLLP